MADSTQADTRRLKYELKTWERSFSAAHGGRKATKADIKADLIIAAKYRQYSQLCRSREEDEMPSRVPQDDLETQQANHTHLAPAGTPSKSRIIAASPRKTPGKSERLAVMSPTPQAIRMRLGPTPQKDGQILSLFDTTCAAATPSKTRTALIDVDGNVAATPSRGNSILVTEDAENARPSRTPTSSGKRYMLDTFATPMKRKRDDTAHTPSSSRGIHATPQFLRRTNVLFSRNLGPLEEIDEDIADKKQPSFKKRSLARSLSSIIRGLRAHEDEKADEDLDLLRELEGDMFEPVAQPSDPVQHEKQAVVPVKKVPETQVEMPLGPDTIPVSDDENNDQDGLDANGQPRKVWKKKGLKRQTKRVIMRPRPQAAKPDTTPATDLMEFSSVKDDHSEHEQSRAGSESDLSDSEVRKTSQASKSGKGTEKDAATNPTEPRKKKVNATAHANFCRLKIKNKNSKAKGRGRFGRR
ncbi:putative DNA replication and checkpoint protein [Elsinoe fawcettii]|nr:putative DNA replication and checkpoint protein [Elsinoe fawcettii]